MENRVYTVYKGVKKRRIVYIGTTIQKPKDRFRWHKYNGKDLEFSILFQYEAEDKMLEKEFELIKKYNPAMNKIKHRKQNLNVKLSKEVIESRVGNKVWCQCCLRRRVSVGYEKCMWCGKN